MYEIGEKYTVVGLKTLAKEKFERSCALSWNSPDFAVAATYAFCTTIDDDKGLQDIVSATISAHKELVRKAEIKVLLAHFNGLALGILEQVIEENGW